MQLKSLKYFTKKWILPPVFYDSLKRKKPKNITNDFVERTKMVKDRHLGKRCFILGAGSSIKQQDLKKLVGEFVIGVSNTYVHPDYHLFKPQYHVLPHILRGHSQIFPEEKFIEWLKEMDERIFDAEIFLHYGDKRMVDENNIFKKRKIHWVEYCDWKEDFNTPIDPGCIPDIWSVSEVAVTLSVYMGFKNIYLLGFDHDWFNGPMVYFYDKKTEHKMHPADASLSFADAEFQMRRHAYIFKKYKYLYSIKKNIYNANANQNTYVDVFPKKKFEDLFL